MPELPEVETVRAGLARHVLGRTVTGVHVHGSRVARRHDGGPADLVGRLERRTFTAAVRRGKFCWLLLDEPDEALLLHLGMSGQLLVRPAGQDQPTVPHLRVRLDLDDGSALDFVDQRTFGYVAVPDLVPTADGGPGGLGSDMPALPAPVAHIARDLLDPVVDRRALALAMRRRHTQVKRALLDQTLVSGVGNIYADEGLWRARLHGGRATDSLRPVEAARVLDGAAEVLAAALAAGGTSFDALYVDVDGGSGWFERELAVYGREGLPCPRCGTPIRREAFANRSSYSCPHCQPRPRPPRVEPLRP
ncbi:MAG TPA: bifunctional DNA-formamidopyrimidine glycosylase/DNA-(apurinic or apyrimidinic site) lyase [Cellulomonas sp.]